MKTKKYYRYFGMMLERQIRWLNKMSAEGWRLSDVGKALYEFEPCEPGEYCYQIEFVAEMSRAKAEDYREFLEGLGYTVRYKNANLIFSVGKVRWRPWAETGGQLATNGTTFGRELLIVEKKNDGKKFVLHTSAEDRVRYAKKLRDPWIWTAGIFLGCAIGGQSWIFGGVGLAAVIPAVLYQMEIRRIRRERTE